MREWRKLTAELEKLQMKKRRLKGGGRKPALPEMEEELSSYNLRSSKFTPVSSKRLLNWLKQMVPYAVVHQFKQA